MTARARTLTLSLIGAFAVIALVAGFAAREPIERALFVTRVARATGLVIDVDRAERDGDAYDVMGLRAHTRGGAAIVEAPHARIRADGSNVGVVLDGARLTLDLDRYRGDEVEKVRGETGTFSLDARDATLTVVAGDVPVPLVGFDGVSGSLHLEPSETRYAVTGNFDDGGSRYPITGRSETSPSGATTHAWSAAELPIGPFVPFVVAGARTHPMGGSLRDLDLRFGESTHATVRLDDVSLALGSHAISGLHGALDFEGEGDGVGSRSLVGRLDGAVPFEAAGEVHDLPRDGAWLRAGSNDLRALARLAEAIANEPQLRSARVEATAPGLAFGQYGLQTVRGPLAISVLSIDPHEPTLRFDTALAEDHVISGGERTSAMGLRTGAVAGVNGDYFDIGRTYQPQGMLVKSGTLVRGPTDRAALSIDRDKNVTFSEFRMHGSVRTSRGTMPITEFNDWPPGYVSVITRDYGRTLHGVGNATFVALEPEGSGGKRYRVTNVVPPGGAPDVAFGIAIGERVRVPIPHVGDTLELTYATDPATSGAVAAIGGGPILLRNGAWFEDPHAPAPDERDYRWPVVALARADEGRLLLVAVDGRHPERSVGATRPEFAAILLRLGATDAMALDSGGSVTLVSRAPGDTNVSVRNVPSDNSAERWVSDGLFLYSSAPSPSIVAPLQAPTPVPEARPSP